MMIKEDSTLMKALARLTQDSLKKVLGNALKDLYKEVVETKSYIYAVGDIPIALVAHMDTVFTSLPTNIYYDKEKHVMWSPEGLGADDRAGIYAILQILKAGYKPTVIFTTDEEIGAVGAGNLVADVPNFPTNLSYVIQLDRRGINDCVYYDCDNKEFKSYIENFGFEETLGSFSDISVICPAWKVAGVNLSVGYVDEHTPLERVNFKYLHQTIDKVIAMLNEEEVPAFEYVEMQYFYNQTGPVNYREEDDEYSFLRTKCHRCGRYSYAYNMVPAISKDGQDTHYYCIDCCGHGISWCDECFEAYEDGDKPSMICPRCLAKKKEVKEGRK